MPPLVEIDSREVESIEDIAYGTMGQSPISANRKKEK